MRDIKFRGKRVDNNEWVYGDLVHWQLRNDIPRVSIIVLGCEIYSECAFEVIPETVGQYTGLKDKNGNEIYEGDIVQDNLYRLIDNVILSVEFGTYGIRFKNKYGQYIFPKKNKDNDLELEVIGNIFDNGISQE